jgi:hypothetical protein
MIALLMLPELAADTCVVLFGRRAEANGYAHGKPATILATPG